MAPRGDKKVTGDPGADRVLQESFADLQAASALLATSERVGDDVVGVLHAVVRRASKLVGPELDGHDPYLKQAYLAGLLSALAALDLGDEGKRRRELRIGLERARQAARDMLDQRHVASDRPIKDIVRWLLDDVGLSVADAADLAGVAPRTLQRWADPRNPTTPGGADQDRLRTLARMVDHLRWGMTATGVVRWLGHPNRHLDGHRPAELLADPTAYLQLVRLAGSTRSMVAT